MTSMWKTLQCIDCVTKAVAWTQLQKFAKDREQLSNISDQKNGND